MRRSDSSFRRVPIPSVLPCVVALAALAWSERAGAQALVDRDFSIQRFQPGPGPRNFLATRGARMDGEMAFSAGVMANYGFEPFTVNARTEVKVVENVLTADVLGGFVPVPMVQIGLRLPVTWVKGQGIDDEGEAETDGLSGSGLGDPELEGKVRVVGRADDPVTVGVALSLTAPLGNAMAEDKFIGDGSPTVGVRGILDGRAGPLIYALNAGGAYRNSADVGATPVGSELRYSAVLGYEASPAFRVFADAFGATRMSSGAGGSVMEALGALQIQPVDVPIAFTAGAGAAVVDSVGSASVRAVFGVMYVSEKKDQDDDKLNDNDDQCPTEAEDRDGYQDEDGCPDGDNDLDAIEDKFDKCPSQAEDQDNFEDRDGCPDPDNDKDGLVDTADQCPTEPESKNDYKDEDGCPDESDKDNDGVPDSRDGCAEEPEDTDGFEDTDGCPDPDNDKDNVPDGADECLDEPETINEFEDEDGCPDEAPKGFRPKR